MDGRVTGVTERSGMGLEVMEGFGGYGRVWRLRKEYGGYGVVYGVYRDLDSGAVMWSKELY